MIRRPPRSTQGVSSAASDVYKRQGIHTQDARENPSYFKTFHTHSYFSFFGRGPSTSYHLVAKGYACIHGIHIHGIHTQDAREKPSYFKTFHTHSYFSFFGCGPSRRLSVSDISRTFRSTPELNKHGLISGGCRFVSIWHAGLDSCRSCMHPVWTEPKQMVCFGRS